MQALKYSIRVTLSNGGVPGWEKNIQEIWVGRPNGKSFAFNDEGGVFFCPEPRRSERMPEPQLIDIDLELTHQVVAFLEIKEQLLSMFGKTLITGGETAP